MIVALRYTVSLIAATLVSFLLFFLMVAVGANISHLLSALRLETLFLKGSIVAIGFIGVFVATVIAPRGTRHISSWIFTLLGLSFYCWVWFASVPSHQRSYEDAPPTLPFLPWLFIGGCLCSSIFLIRKKGRTGRLT